MGLADLDEPMRTTALAFANGMADFWLGQLGARLIGVYLIGSLAHGGFNRRYSDIDMALIAEDGVAEPELDAMRGYAARLAPDLATKLSLFWADGGFGMGRFPPLDRVDLIDHAIALVERERIRPARPSLDDVRAYLRGAPFANWAETARRLASLERLEAVDRKPYLRALLYPARFIYSWLTGGMASNEAAVALVLARAPEGLDFALLEKALACRHAAADPDLLFPARTALPRQVAACARLIDH